MKVRGSVDEVTTTEVRGWAFAPGRESPVVVQATLNHEVFGETLAALHRPDLAEAGLGDGNSGFLIKLSRPIDPLYIPFLTVKIDGGDAELPRAPVLGFAEFFSALYTAYPATGRSRSVLGGFWTDRTDAAAVLRGKTRIGQVPRDAVPALSELISNGLAIIDLKASQAGRDWQKAMAESVGELLETKALIAPLQAIFEDNPLAVKSTWMLGNDSELTQPSIRNPSLSPAECVEIIVPLGAGVSLDVVRESHLLPEFTLHGVSRWGSRAAADSIGIGAASGRLDSYPLAISSVALVGPGTLYRVACGQGTAIRLLCLPERCRPVALMAGGTVEELVRANGARVYV